MRHWPTKEQPQHGGLEDGEPFRTPEAGNAINLQAVSNRCTAVRERRHYSMLKGMVWSWVPGKERQLAYSYIRNTLPGKWLIAHHFSFLMKMHPAGKSWVHSLVGCPVDPVANVSVSVSVSVSECVSVSVPASVPRCGYVCSRGTPESRKQAGRKVQRCDYRDCWAAVRGGGQAKLGQI